MKRWACKIKLFKMKRMKAKARKKRYRNQRLKKKQSSSMIAQTQRPLLNENQNNEKL